MTLLSESNETPLSARQSPDDEDHPKEKCGVFGIWGDGDASRKTALGLHALQHRGQEAAGIVSFDGRRFHAHRDMGQVSAIFGKEEVMIGLKGKGAIGHVRYSTTGGTAQRNIQPLFAELAIGGFCLAHNGNLTNAASVRDRLVEKGAIFQSTADTEVIVHLIARQHGKTMVERLMAALLQVEGAYSLVCMGNDCVIGVRDPLGVRPLVLGKHGKSYIVTSETCALDILGAEFIRDVEPGEAIVLNEEGLTSIKPFPASPHRFCVFEYIYFARPDSCLGNRSVYAARKQIGMELSRESPVAADAVIPVPDSGVPAALGYSEESGISFELGIIRNHYVGRTFIEPAQRIRDFGVKLKHNANRAIIEGRRVILVDDSIVRGTTSVKIVQMVRAAGAREVHMRIASPPTVYSCFYGIDTPERSELLASRMSEAQMAQYIGADSLAFISIDGLYRAMGLHGRNNLHPQFCDACLTGDYPIKLSDRNARRNQNTPDGQLSLLSEFA
ncbi:MAG: amidophosphoribosyltransferase [Rhodospirillales bacterium]|nr:amidophosphoribosyltransferase [Rhodospirillales bacterium]